MIRNGTADILRLLMHDIYCFPLRMLAPDFCTPLIKCQIQPLTILGQKINNIDSLSCGSRNRTIKDTNPRNHCPVSCANASCNQVLFLIHQPCIIQCRRNLRTHKGPKRIVGKCLSLCSRTFLHEPLNLFFHSRDSSSRLSRQSFLKLIPEWLSIIPTSVLAVPSAGDTGARDS